ncbi:hypothetical protein [Rhizobium rhizophilum]|uniref:Restriction alleviation protein Lar n=1 Tax=Rhizobium rhizophilum TaxID=1850373 RepID=A0ABY2QTV1_9HYPH|nr:hypothetical protein [Rhizobium rhizophilum]THV13758.1 hypothetical protein E9677_12685 [Rhizobium rhizophilum]
MTELLKCPICDKPLLPDDLCASDIEMGACHAECLEGSPVVDLDTGEEMPGSKADTFRARAIMEPGRQQRDKFESAVVKCLHKSGFLEVEIRTECLARVGQGYQDEVINAGWHYWNEALWQNIPLVDPVLGRSPDGLDFATPDEVFDKGPEAVREWQEARGRKPETPPPSSHVAALDAHSQSLLAAQKNVIDGLKAENDRLRKMLAGCDWYWPEDDTSSNACADGPWQIAENHDVKPGEVFGYSRGGVVETRYYGFLEAAEDSDSDDQFEADEPTREAAEAKIAAEVERRAALATTEGSTDD